MQSVTDAAGPSDATNSARLALVVSVLMGVGAFASIPVIVIIFVNEDSVYGDVIFPIVLIAGVLALVSGIALLVFMLRALGLEDRKFALGMPDGSIRAIIAVMLILLFGMMAIFLYLDTTGRSQTLDSISQEALDALPANRLIGVRQLSDDPPRYRTIIRVEGSDASQDLAKQLVTTVSTLVVAIAAFYFGSQSVDSARRKALVESSTSSAPPTASRPTPPPPPPAPQ